MIRKQTSGPGGGGGGSGSPVTVIFYPSAGDGFVNKNNASWDTTHDALTGASANYIGNTFGVSSGKASLKYKIQRVFLPFDTSFLPDNASITDAKLKVYVTTKLNNDNDGDDFVTVVQATEPSVTALTTADYDLAGSINNPTEGIDTTERKDITNVPIKAYLVFNLNSTGKNWISKTGFTKLALREGHDVKDSPFIGIDGQSNSLTTRTSEYSATTYDPILEVTYTTSGSTPAPTILQDLNYTYDANGNITKIVDASLTNSGKTVDYTYDDLNRLLSATASGVASGQSAYAHTFTYNALGNITNKSDVGVYTYTGTGYANPHAATSINEITQNYDNNGNLTADTIWTNTWDFKNKLTQSAKTGVTVSYTYDHNGSRVKLVTPTLTTILPSQYYSKEGSADVKYIIAGGDLIATVRGTGVSAIPYYMHTDQLGGSAVVTDGSANVKELTDYFAFGEQRIHETSSFEDRKGYIGKDFDTDTGLSQLEARYYSGKQGRFISEDSSFWELPMELLVDPQLQNSYNYARNNPISLKDPSGKMPKQWRDVLKKTISAIKSAFSKQTATGQMQGPVKPASTQKTTTWDPITDQRIKGLDFRVQQSATNFINNTEDQLNTQLRVNEGYRSIEAQNKLYNQGRTTPGNIVTKSKGGESYHNYGLALDVIYVENGKENRNKQITPQVANIGIRQGFEWGGAWSSFKDYPHFQMTFGQSWQDLLKENSQ